MRKNLKPNMFVTFFIAYLNARSGRLVYSNAGHNPVVIFDPSRKRCSFHKMAGPPLGIFPPTEFDMEIEEYEIQLEPGALILQYTDGLNESMNTHGQQFSLNRILSECKRNAVSGAKTLVPCLIDAERKFRGDSPPADDVAVLALSVGERVPARANPGE
ncbi:MAG: PP2C family protein-serine/threonine phosphatase [bacterium]